jgi:hypothetical protein
VSRKRRTTAGADRTLHAIPGPSREERIFYVAVEGQSTEPDYLDYLNKEYGQDRRFRIQPLWRRNGLKPREVVETVLAERGPDEDWSESWALFDRDEHTGIPQAFATARENSVRVGFSHPSFDLWLLLHFTASSGAQSGSSDLVHEKLRRCQGFERFGVNGDKSVRHDRLDALKGNERAAAQRARKLTNDCSNQECDEHRGHVDRCDPVGRDPSTNLWELLAALKIID